MTGGDRDISLPAESPLSFQLTNALTLPPVSSAPSVGAANPTTQ
jgi:hypothetical protein